MPQLQHLSHTNILQPPIHFKLLHKNSPALFRLPFSWRVFFLAQPLGGIWGVYKAAPVNRITKWATATRAEVYRLQKMGWPIETAKVEILARGSDKIPSEYFVREFIPVRPS